MAKWAGVRHQSGFVMPYIPGTVHDILFSSLGLTISLCSGYL